MLPTRRLLCGLLACGLLAACAKAGAPPAGPLVIVQTQPIEQPVPGSQNGAVAQETAALLNRSLLTVGPSGALVPDAATVVPTRANGGISADGRRIVYHLKPGLHFADGAALGATDVAATIDALRAPGARVASRLGLDDVAAVHVEGPLVVSVDLARPFAPILLYLCAPGNATVILPASKAAAVESSAVPPPFAGAGPYRVRAFTAGDRMELEPNPWYSPVPRTPALVIRSVDSAQTAHVQLQTGEADGYIIADPSRGHELADIPGLAIRSTPVDGVGAIIFNTTAPAVADAATRHAIVEALDIAGTVKRVFHGGVSSADAPAGLFLWAYDRRAFPQPPYDPAAAGRLLDARGWRRGADGRRYRNGVPLDLSMIVRSDQPSSSAIAATFAQQLRDLGVTVETRQYAIAEWGAPDGPLYSGRFDVAIAQFFAGFDPDVTDQFGCDRIPPHGYNKPRYCNPHLDRLLARAAATYSRPERLALYADAQRILARDLPMMPIYRLVLLDALPATLTGVNESPVTTFYGVAGWRR